MKFAPCIPILRFYDEERTKDFYFGFLGFNLEWEHRFEPGTPLYFQLSLGAAVLQLSEHHGDVAPGSAVRIQVDDIEAYHAKITARPYKYYRPGIEAMPWGTHEIKVIDPAFNRLMFFAPSAKS